MLQLNWRITAVSAGLILSVLLPAVADDRVPVMVGGEAGLDACGGVGIVTGLKAIGDGFLAVRAGPAVAYPMLAKLHNGHRVFMCQDSNGWIGIVYRPDGGLDCEVASPIAKPQPYRGRCASGWVHSSFVKLVAG